jgi:hypothetical protein
MTYETIVLLESITETTDDPAELTFSDKKKGSGYNGRGQGQHTAVFELSNFLGVLKLQGTLEINPGNADWVDIKFDDESEISSEDSTVRSGNISKNFTGNWLWIRAAYSLQQGSISRIRFNF